MRHRQSVHEIQRPLERCYVLLCCLLNLGNEIISCKSRLIADDLLRTHGGGLGEGLFLLALGVGDLRPLLRVYILGVESVLPADWRNGALR